MRVPRGPRRMLTVPRKQSLIKRDLATLIQGADCSRKRLAAVVALIDAWRRALAIQFGRIANDTTTRADRTIRPARRLKMPAGGLFIVENRVRQIDAQGHPPCPIFYQNAVSPERGPVRQVRNFRLNYWCS